MKVNCNTVWSKCLELIREEISPKAFKTWFEPVKASAYQHPVLTLQVPSMYIYECLEDQFVEPLRNAIHAVIGPGAKLEYSVSVEETPVHILPPPGKAPFNKKDLADVGIRNPFTKPAREMQIDSRLNPSYTLESFIEGSCNRLARSAGEAIALNPGTTAFNPLLIYGGSGLGKTHLAQAIGMEVKRKHPEKVVLYVTTNLFQTQFTEAVRKNEINDFLHFYQMIDVLILDDIQELAGKTATQNTFFHIFNHLHQSKKQLILTSDRSPAELSGMEERLLSRFRWGLAAEIKTPAYETRLAIARYKALKDGIDFSEEVLSYICRHVNTNVRELEGAMISLLAQATFNRKELTIESVQEILGKMVQNRKVELTVERIKAVVCDYFRMPEALLEQKTRKREVVQARQLAMYFCKNHTNASLAYIGNQIGKKDHTTVLYACKAVADQMETDRGFKIKVDEIHQKLFS